ncbi:S-layer homology domain-containing protein [Inediibacterium massiliense]|uniref:S-layer homology domain-containing protein n=1 Tax=Inediibacterium massiliense TaxID=1658111 RepID=UPI0006B45596|nr:S-layer homology domain-containing protein [Inediibacterium massiliense]
MKKCRGLLFLLSFLMIFNVFMFDADAASKVSRDDVYNAAQKTIKYYHDTYKDRKYEGILDWPALGLFGFGEDVAGPKWTVDGKNGPYFREQEVKAAKLEPGYCENGLRSGVNTDFQRTIIAVCASGKEPRNFGGKNLVEIEKNTMLPNGHFADSVMDNETGKPVGEDLVNAHIFGIIAMHCAGEPIPNRDKCLSWLEGQQNLDGGFTFDVKKFDDPEDYKLVESDVDMTAGALMAFAILGEDEKNPHVKKALDFLHNKQLDNGGFESWGTVNPESCAWAIQAITLLGQDPMGPEWTKKSGGNPVSALLTFQIKDGSFVHVLEEEDLPVYSNGMSTEQALYGLADAYNKKAAYDLLHEKYRSTAEKNLFSDLKDSDFAFKEIMDLVYNYVLSGYEDGTFKPKKNVTRAEAATLLINTLNLKKEKENYTGSIKFIDVDENHWASKAIGLCDQKGYIKGTGENTFASTESITGEQLAVILVKAKGLEGEVKNIDANGQSWSYPYVKIAKDQGLLYEGFKENEPVNRAQISWSLSKIKNK